MLDSETKSRIDSARDILVGKVPDPKSQVEQITIALIYKFMDDMDRQSEELGGKATFFSGEFKKYSWPHLMDPRLGGHERLLRYAECIEKMNQNKNIPQLFRDIFKGAFLPYRDPETLNLFLKEINGFVYDHSERLGDAFEYLLSVLGSQGEAGQFRTPRHIIDFIVKIVDPKKNETVLDPACGTAGFLISSFKHIMAANTKGRSGDLLSADERGRLMTNFNGYDISPDMVRLSRVNMYLHGFAQPRIYEYDTLTSEERWDERCDVILANPPFMSPKGGIRPHNRFSIKVNRSEVLFVDYIAEHLNTGGRAGIIVPEGIIFQSQNAYKALRKMLIENYLWAVVSLPAGCFNPYSGVKTSILFLDKSLAKRTDEILFMKIEGDGFGLGAQRRANDKDDLPEALLDISDFKLRILDLKKSASANHQSTIHNPQSVAALSVKKSRILESADINLSGDRYRDNGIRASGKWPMGKLGDTAIFRIESGGTPSSSNPVYWDGNVCWTTLVDLPEDEIVSELKDTKRKITEKGLKESSAILLPVGSILVSSRATIGRISVNRVPTATNQGFKNIVIKDKKRANPFYVAYAVTRLVPQMELMASGGTFKEISKTNFSTLEIPLPPLEEQERIVAELNGYQKVIDGAKQVIVNYKPIIKINPQWPIVLFKDAPFEIIDGDRGTNYPKKEDFSLSGYCLFLNTKNVRSGGFDFSEMEFVSKEKDQALRKGRLQRGDVVLTTRGTIGNIGFYDESVDFEHIRINSGMLIFRPDSARLSGSFLFRFFQSENFCTQKDAIISGAAQPQLPIRSLNEATIPLPPLDVQREIGAELEAERALVESSRKLVEIFEKKIRSKLAEIWGEIEVANERV